jgi:error-prone DNA polymerase
LSYARGLREEAAQALVQARTRRPFSSIDDLALRVPELRKNELVLLAEIGALNSVSSFEFPVSSQTGSGPAAGNWKPETGNWKLHRRDALWQVERACRRPGPLLEGMMEPDLSSPLARMSEEERLVADFGGTGLTVGPHPMAYRRREMEGLGVCRAADLPRMVTGQRVRTAGCVIARQRPGTARGFLFLSLEDETGIANAILTPDLFARHRLLLISEPFLLIEGVLQNQDNVVSIKAERVAPLASNSVPTQSHDFY